MNPTPKTNAWRNHLSNAAAGLVTGVLTIVVGFCLVGLYQVVANLIGYNNNPSGLMSDAWFIIFLAYCVFVCLLVIFGLPIFLARKHQRHSVAAILLYEGLFYTLVIIVLSLLVYSNPASYSGP